MEADGASATGGTQGAPPRREGITAARETAGDSAAAPVIGREGRPGARRGGVAPKSPGSRPEPRSIWSMPMKEKISINPATRQRIACHLSMRTFAAEPCVLLRGVARRTYPQEQLAHRAVGDAGVVRLKRGEFIARERVEVREDEADLRRAGVAGSGRGILLDSPPPACTGAPLLCVLRRRSPCPPASASTAWQRRTKASMETRQCFSSASRSQSWQGAHVRL